MPSSRLALTALAMLAAAAPAFAQLGKDRDAERKKREAAKNAQPTPATPATPPKPTEPIADKVLQRDRPTSWQVSATVDISAGADTVALKNGVAEVPREFKLSSAALVFPVLRRTASSQIAWSAPNQEILSGAVRWNEGDASARMSIQDGYAAGARLARWELRDVEGVKATLQVDFQVDSFDTRFDEDLASTIPWPAGGWPALAQSALTPQLFIEHESPEIKALVKKFTEGAEPKSIPPLKLAKWLASEVMNMYTPAGSGLLGNDNGSLMGFDLRGAKAMSADGRGSPHDLVCLLVAVYRAAGLPARAVIGIDTGREGTRGLGNRNASSLRSWAEFCLIDPFDRKEIWIPIDLNRLRRAGTRAPAVDRPWKYLGTHDELSTVVPIAFQFHPPTNVQARAPMFWGWITNPPVAQLDQSFRWTVARAPRKNNDRPEWRKD